MKLIRWYLVCSFVLSLMVTLFTADLFAQDNDEIRKLIDEAGEAKDFSGANRILIFDRTLADVQDSGLTYVTQKRLWKVLKSSGGLNLRSIVWDYDPLSGLVEVKEAKVFRKSGEIELIPSEKVFTE